MIAEQYIQEGIRIRKSYIKNLKEILKQEPIIQDRKIKFQELQKEMESIVNSDLNDVRKALKLNEKLIILDREMKKVQDIIKPFHDNIEKLRDDKDKLYLAIKEKYPNITQQEIEKDIMSKVDE
jgi:hypothetical protein